MVLPAIPAPRRWRNAPVVREPDRKRARRALSVFAALALACSPVGLYLLQIMRHVEIDYAIEAVRSTQTELAEAERRLSIERAELASLPDVEQRAVEDLGLVRPDPLETIVLRRDGVSRNHSPDPRPDRRAR
jgi:hypothetical protein